VLRLDHAESGSSLLNAQAGRIDLAYEICWNAYRHQNDPPQSVGDSEEPVEMNDVKSVYRYQPKQVAENRTLGEYEPVQCG
jgi:hypothetical protein